MALLTVNAWLGLLTTAAALLIGTVATYSMVSNTRGPRERGFVLFHCLAAWSAIALLLILIWITPSPYSLLWLIPYFLHLPVAVYRFASKLQLIRHVEAREGARRHDQSGVGIAGSPAP